MNSVSPRQYCYQGQAHPDRIQTQTRGRQTEEVQVLAAGGGRGEITRTRPDSNSFLHFTSTEQQRTKPELQV